ncbi:MAG TPA: hypothetical protein VF614_05960 [Chthoniobacteraceae bacterium]
MAATAPTLLLSPKEEAVKEQIAQDFLDEFADEAKEKMGGSEEPVINAEKWVPAQKRADDRLRVLLGDVAYIQQNLETARAALTSEE